MRGAGVKTAVGTVVVSVAVAGIFLWTGTRSSVALADVLVKVEQVPAFMYKMTMRVKGGMQGMALPDHDVETSVLIASEYGMRMDTSSSDPNGSPGMMQQMYVLPQQNQMLMLMPAMKKYIRMEVDAQMFEERRQEGNDPRLMLKKILECEYTDLGKTVLDGVEVRGFQTTDPAFGEGLGDINVKVWVDRKTELPVRVDLKFRMGERMEMEGTLHDFQWDVPVSAAEFNPVIPPDFTPGPGDGLKVPPMTEETAIAGLKLCYELNGKYPDDLNLMTLIRVMTEGFKDKWTAATPESPQPPDLTALLERMKKSRLEMPPEPPSPSASREEWEKWSKEVENWREDHDRAFAEEKKMMEEVDRRRNEWVEEREKRHEDLKKMIDGNNDHVKKMAEKMMPVQALGGFYMTLVQEQKEPTYYGKVVTPGDIVQVLLRWKTGANEYRVIFADLHGETVTGETLATLEAALPQ